jgi:hypothetical protein
MTTDPPARRVAPGIPKRARHIADRCDLGAADLRAEAATRPDIDDATRARKLAAANQAERYGAELRADADTGDNLDRTRLALAEKVADAANLGGILTAGDSTAKRDRDLMQHLAYDRVLTQQTDHGRPFYALSAYAEAPSAEAVALAAEYREAALRDAADRDAADRAAAEHHAAAPAAERVDDDGL